jgi:hypothetical protein
MTTHTNNEGILGKSFAVGNGRCATYVPTNTVPLGFRFLCECAPYMTSDHIVYGKLLDNEYVGVGQPYPLEGDEICAANQYFRVIGMRALFTTGSVWSERCMRIHIFKDAGLSERFDVAKNCVMWHDMHSYTCEAIMDRVDRTIDGRSE